MKTTPVKGALAAVVLLSTLNPQLAAVPLGTAFTYQGRLSSGANAANGSYDLKFSLYDTLSSGSQIGSSLTNAATGVTNGYFTVTLDFGNYFDGNARWLEIGVRTNGGGTFTPLSPRQALTAVPYALYASSAGTAGRASNLLGVLSAGQLSGTYSNALNLSNPANSFVGNGAGLGSVNAAALGGLGASSFWQLGGNAGTTPGTDFVGTSDNQALELKVNGQRTLRLEPNTNGAPNLIGGSLANFASAFAEGGTIAGGGTTNYVIYKGREKGFAIPNSVWGSFGTVGGGAGNTAGDSGTVAGGWGNEAGGEGAVGGGSGNEAGGYGGTVAGGYVNTALGWYATVGGGFENGATNDYATVPGGYRNVAGGVYSFAAGCNAQATSPGTFVWSDRTSSGMFPTTSLGTNSFVARASGGFALYSVPAPMPLGVWLAPGSMSWSMMSDRNVKRDLAPVDSQAVLAQVAALPLTTWSYITEPGVRHLGPMAQDFYTAFGVGEDDKHITEVDQGGVALAAIQGLNQKLDSEAAALRGEIKRRDAENAGLKREVDDLKQLVHLLNQKLNGGEK